MADENITLRKSYFRRLRCKWYMMIYNRQKVQEFYYTLDGQKIKFFTTHWTDLSQNKCNWRILGRSLTESSGTVTKKK